ncbi:EH domain-containing protein 1-like [Musa acuminata AAA Group]|uniref:EH domain-containing protein 1-like n=1 Tax=Musa acuminata AAA Group TaxID=214697 RepID=UPI0031E4086B
MDTASCLISEEHDRIYGKWFSFVDSDRDGRITENDAICFFAMSNLPRRVLKQIWATADSKRKGYLGFKEFATAMKLVALAQAGNEITQDSLAHADLQKLNPPMMGGLDTLLNSGPNERTIFGNTIALQTDMPFTGLTKFGTEFLSKFECSQMPHSLLERITFVDTPGVLSGEKQRIQRSYDFTGVTSWFAAKCDLIILLFDPHKIDISDEFNNVIRSLHGHEDKIRVVLNKADQVDTEQLIRVNRALIWSLAKVLPNRPEVMRIYNGSFNDKPTNNVVVDPILKKVFERDQNDLLSDLRDIPNNVCDLKIRAFVRRAKAAKVHAYIISHLKNKMPIILGKATAQRRLIDNLENEFAEVRRKYNLPLGDFPDVQRFKEALSCYNIDEFKKLKPKLIRAVDVMLTCDIPQLLRTFGNSYES